MLHSLSPPGHLARRPTCRSPASSEEELLEEAKPDAEQALRREAVLAAVVEAEGIEAVRGRRPRRAAGDAPRSEGTTPEKLRERLEKAGRLDELREDLAQRRAVDLLAEAATPIPSEQAAGARQALDAGRARTPDERRPRAGLVDRLDARGQAHRRLTPPRTPVAGCCGAGQEPARRENEHEDP